MQGRDEFKNPADIETVTFGDEVQNMIMHTTKEAWKGEKKVWILFFNERIGGRKKVFFVKK